VHPQPKTAVVFFAHGSSIESANEAVREVACAAAARAGVVFWETAFLEGGRPDLAGAVASLAAAGATRIAVIPYFLTLGLHLQRDLPRLAAEIAASYPDVEVVCGDPLDGHPALAEILAGRAAEALQRFGATGGPSADARRGAPGGPPSGTADPDASSATAPHGGEDPAVSGGSRAPIAVPAPSKK
jgi:sirohydrochlorin ferrochelatase